MSGNLLIEWKKESYVLSSDLHIGKFKLERKNVDALYVVLEEYFGLDFFKRGTASANNIPNLSYIHSLLVNFKDPATFPVLFELANLILYLKKQPASLQRKLKDTLPGDPRQFRDLLFEVYIHRLLEYNKIKTIKDVKEGKNLEKELDGVCEINGKEYLMECKKEYIPNIVLLQTLISLSQNIFLNLQSRTKGVGLIGTIKLSVVNDVKNKEAFSKKLNLLFSRLEKEIFKTIDYHEKDAYGELNVIDYSKETSIEVNKEPSDYHVIFKVIPPNNPLPNVPNLYTVDMKMNFQVKQYEIERKVLNSLENKKKQHANSKFTNKIYFVDSETLHDLDAPMLIPLNIFEGEKINEFAETLDENEIICFVIRDYTKVVPKTKIKVVGKNVDPELKTKLEGLKTNFDSKAEIS